MSQKSCFVCHSPLVLQSAQFARCSNERCPEGGLVVNCGYCKEFSVTVGPENKGPLICRNPACKMHGTPRTVCPSCQKYSYCEVGTSAICISRTCPGNKAIVKECFFCKNLSFLASPDTNFCTKGDCEYLLVHMERCVTCAERTLDTNGQKCRNHACARYNHKAERCPTCQRLSQYDGVCENADCASHSEGGVFQETLMGEFFLDNLKEILPGAGPGNPKQVTAPTEAPVKSPPLNDLTGNWEQPEWDGELGSGMPRKRPRARTALDFSPFQNLPKSPVVPTPRPDPAPTRAPAPVAKSPLELFGPPPSPRSTPQLSPTQPSPGADPTPQAGLPAASNNQGAGFLFGPTPAAEPSSALDLFSGPKTPPSVATPSGGGDFNLFGPPAGAGTPGPSLGSLGNPITQTPLSASSLALDSDASGGSSAFGLPGGAEAIAGSPAAGSSGGIPDGSRDVGFGEAYEFVLQHILTDRSSGGSSTSPLYLVIGLSGAGKTTFLTILGDILASKSSKYFFPWDGLEAKPIRIDSILSKSFEFRQTPEPVRQKLRAQFKGQIKDLVFEYAQEFFSSYLGKEHWAPPTAKGATFFLATELEYRQRSLAKIVTVETAGEDWKALLYALSGRRLAAADEDRLQTLRKLLNTAEGMIVLLDPADDKTDEIYQNFFLILKEAVAPRARNRARELIREKTSEPSRSSEPSAGVGPLNFVNLQDDLKRKLETEARRKREKKRFRDDMRDRIAATSRRLEIRGVAALSREDTEFISQLKAYFFRVDPRGVERAEKFLQDHRYSQDAVLKFSKQMLQRGQKILDQIVDLVFDDQGSSALSEHLSEEDMAVEEAWRQIVESLKLDPEFRMDINSGNLLHRDPVGDFPNLKKIAIVVTKTDMYPIVYPPERYPDYKLPKSKQSIGPLAQHLKILGGGIHYYNSSATGYSVTRNGRPFPGSENTLCPINIIEPVIDMIDLQT